MIDIYNATAVLEYTTGREEMEIACTVDTLMRMRDTPGPGRSYAGRYFCVLQSSDFRSFRIWDYFPSGFLS